MEQEQDIDPKLGRKPFDAFLYLVIILFYCWLATYGSMQFFGTEIGSASYDELGSSILHGYASVQSAYEADKINGHYYIYFGFFPGVLHAALNALFTGHETQWSRVSCLIAAFISAGLMISIIYTACITSIQLRTMRQRQSLYRISVVAACLGSPLFFLISCPYIYHEAILWGLVGSLICILFFIRIISKKPRPMLMLGALASGAAIALLSRFSFSIPAYLLLLICVLFLWKGRDNHPLKFWWVCLAVMPAILAGLMQLDYNRVRYGSIFNFAGPSSHAGALQAHLEQIGFFNVRRLPITLLNYFGFSSQLFIKKFPFVTPVTVLGYDERLFMPGYREWVVSLLVVSPWHLLTALGGVLCLREQKNSLALAAGLLAFAPQIAMILTFFWVTHRYTGDLLPVLVLSQFVFLKYGFGRGQSYKAQNRILWLAGGLSAFSVIATMLSTLAWMVDFNWGATNTHRMELAYLIQGINKFFNLY